jgi:integrase
MGVFKRGKFYWYRFKFNGQVIRVGTKSKSRDVAQKAERNRRLALENSFNGIAERKPNVLFRIAADEWFAEKAGLAAKSQLGYKQRLVHVKKAFAKCLVGDIDVARVVRYRTERIAQGASNRTVNYEVGCIRGVLKRYGRWTPIGERISKLRDNHDVGRALSAEDETKILRACGASPSPSLLTLFIFARDTGLRAAEMKALRRRDLRLQWKNGVIVSGEVIVPRSKTEAGTGRGVPLSADVCGALTLWLSRFPKATPDSYVFPRHRVEMVKRSTETRILGVVLSEPVQSWDHAWRTALKETRLTYRWHDLRHTFISRLAENPNVSEQTIKALAGHVSKQMLERYSHIRTRAKQDAIATLHAACTIAADSRGGTKRAQFAEPGKSLERVRSLE